MKQTFFLAHVTARKRAAQAVAEAPDGYRVTIQEPAKKRPQEEKYHAQIAECAAQATYAGRKWSKEDMKRILIDEFADEMRAAGTPLHHDTRYIPSEDGRRIISLSISSADFYVKEASAFIEFLYAWGTARGVEFHDQQAVEA